MDHINQATRLNVVIFGITFALSGMAHGFCEAIQGNIATGGNLILAIPIGCSWSGWSDGSLGAFTLIQNYWYTGILAMLIGALIIAWSIGFVHKKHGATIYLTLFVLLFLTGGGIAQVAYFIPAWIVATMIRKPLTWYEKRTSAKVRKILAKAWPYLIGIASFADLAALVMTIWGFAPGIHDMNTVLVVIMAFLCLSLLLFLAAYFAGFARDVEHKPSLNIASNIHVD